MTCKTFSFDGRTLPLLMISQTLEMYFYLFRQIKESQVLFMVINYDVPHISWQVLSPQNGRKLNSDLWSFNNFKFVFMARKII